MANNYVAGGIVTDNEIALLANIIIPQVIAVGGVIAAV